MHLHTIGLNGRERRTSGQSLIEGLVGLFALLPVIIVLFDLTVIVLAVQINDSTCREAARVAASGDPANNQQRANAVIQRANARLGNIICNCKLISCTSTATSSYLATLKQFGGPVNACVTVQTEISVRPFVFQWVYNSLTPMKLRSQQMFPFTYVMPSAAAPP
jgi:hypothetical protein